MNVLSPDIAFPYEFVFPPREYQLYEFIVNAEKKYGHLFWTMRSGKSKTVIDCITHLWLKGEIDSVIIFTRKGLHIDWVTQHFPKHCTVGWEGFRWDSTKRKRQAYIAGFQDTLVYPGLKVFTFNNHAILIKQCHKFLKHILKGRTFFIADESSDFGRVGSRITRLMIELANKCTYRRILSGSHIGNSPLRLFTQFQLLEKGCLGFDTYTDFKTRYAITRIDHNKKTGNRYEVIDAYINQPELQNKVEQFGTILRPKDIPGLPKVIKTTITVVPSKEQMRVYRTVANEFKTELLSGIPIRSFDVAPKLQKLQQILSNFIKEGDNIYVVDPDENPMLDTLFHQILIENEKCVVWCRYREEVDMVYKEAQRRKLPTLQIHGGIRDRDERILQFQEAEGAVVLAATPTSIGLGRNLSTAKTVYWYTKDFDAVVEQQANERATEFGAHSVGVVSLQVPNSIHTYIQKNLDEKANHYTTMKARDWKVKFLEEFHAMELLEL